jgi:hypothetical protein
MGEESGTADISLTRMYASADGETHFEDVTVKTTRVAFAPDLPGGDMASPLAVTELTFARMDARYTRDWHPAPVGSSCSSRRASLNSRFPTGRADASGRGAWSSPRTPPGRVTGREQAGRGPASSSGWPAHDTESRKGCIPHVFERKRNHAEKVS